MEGAAAIALNPGCVCNLTMMGMPADVNECISGQFVQIPMGDGISA